MHRRMVAVVVAAGVVLAVAPAGAQERPNTSFSESSRSSGPTCVVGGTVSDCAGGMVAPFPIAPVVVAPFPVTAPFPGVVFGGLPSGVSTDVDVDRSTSHGMAAAR